MPNKRNFTSPVNVCNNRLLDAFKHVENIRGGERKLDIYCTFSSFVTTYIFLQKIDIYIYNVT